MEITASDAVRVYDFYDPAKTDSEAVDACLSFTALLARRVILFDTKNWLIDRAVLLPSDTTVIVDGVTIKQANGVFDNIFRADNFTLDPADPNGFPLGVAPVKNIRILGLHNARLEGPDVNARMLHPVLGEVQDMVGDFWGWRGFQISLSLCTGFEIGGFTVVRQRSWAMSFDRCAEGHIHDCAFYSEVKNGDGINIRAGCHHIAIENITIPPTT